MEYVQLGHNYGAHLYTDSELNAMKTRVLLKELRATYVLDWD